MMIGIADSGSTKTEWCFLNESGEERRVVTGGLNPFVSGSEDIRRCLEKDLYPFIDNSKVKHLFFYGSGCADAAKRGVLQTELEDFFPNADVNIDSDLSGAALALCGNQAGLVGILGTGASTGFYDGEKIIDRIPSLGYVLGDEGSGARIGAHFLADYLRGGMPDSLRAEFAPFCQLPVHEIIDTVYRGKEVARFLGEMAFFSEGRAHEPYVREVMLQEFTAFFRTQILPYGDRITSFKVNLLGSIAYCFRDLLQQTAADCGLQLGKVIKAPMDELVGYFKPQIGTLLRKVTFEADDFS